MSEVKRVKNKNDDNIELPQLKKGNNNKTNLIKQEKKNNNENNLTKLKNENSNKNNKTKPKNYNNKKIELPQLKKEYKNKNEKYNYTITLDDIVKLVEDHELKNDSNIRKEDLIFVKKEEKTLSTREEKNKKLYDNETIKEKNKDISEKKIEKNSKEIVVEKEKINNDDKKELSPKDNKNIPKGKKKKLNKGKLISLIVLLIMIPILAFSTYKIVNYLIDTPKTKDLIKDITDSTEIKEYDSDEAEIIKSDEKPNTPYWNFIKMNLIDVDFNSLKKTNNETVAWLFVGGTNVNYPVVQTNNNDYYLNHSFDKTKNSGGWLFMDYRNNKNEYGRNTIIYGHNMKNSTMFGTLKNLLSKNWYKNEENRIIKMSSEKYNTLWQIYSVYTLETTSDYIQTEFASDDEYQAFIDLVKGRSTANFNTNVTTSDKTLTLSTCHGSAKKLVVHAKLIKIEAK